MENDDKRVRKNRKISKDTESDRSRIKNITNKVHPEYEVPKKRPARRTEEDEEMARKRAEARRKKQHVYNMLILYTVFYLISLCLV